MDNGNDGLIELCYLEYADAIHHQLDGLSYQSTTFATVFTTGCPLNDESENECFGYELVRDLDFNEDDN